MNTETDKFVEYFGDLEDGKVDHIMALVLENRQTNTPLFGLFLELEKRGYWNLESYSLAPLTYLLEYGQDIKRSLNGKVKGENKNG